MEYDKKIDGTLILDKIEFNRVLYRKVIRSNDRGAKVSIPKEMEGKYVYIIIPKEKNK